MGSLAFRSWSPDLRGLYMNLIESGISDSAESVEEMEPSLLDEGE